MTTSQLVLLGVAGLAVVLAILAVAVWHARTVLEETELRTGVSLCALRVEKRSERRRHEHLRAIRSDRVGVDGERTG